MNQGDSIDIRIQTGNAAFEPNTDIEVSRILREMAKGLEDRGELPNPRDYNGNIVGRVEVTEAELETATCGACGLQYHPVDADTVCSECGADGCPNCLYQDMFGGVRCEDCRTADEDEEEEEECAE